MCQVAELIPLWRQCFSRLECCLETATGFGNVALGGGAYVCVSHGTPGHFPFSVDVALAVQLQARSGWPVQPVGIGQLHLVPIKHLPFPSWGSHPLQEGCKWDKLRQYFEAKTGIYFSGSNLVLAKAMGGRASGGCFMEPAACLEGWLLGQVPSFQPLSLAEAGTELPPRHAGGGTMSWEQV